MDEPRDYHTSEVSQMEKDKHHTSLIHGIYLQKRNRLSKNRLVVAKGDREGER